jgi:hypothetical protein
MTTTTTRRVHRAQIGSISTGTLRDEDLLQAFTSELERLDIKIVPGSFVALIAEANALIEAANPTRKSGRRAGWSDEQREAAAYLINEGLIDALNEFAPPFVYFGSIEGDGADFGFWPDMDGLNEAMRHDGVQVGEYVLLPDEGLLVSVSDHGNVAVYEVAAGAELWSIV